jgi:hypothetical protein
MSATTLADHRQRALIVGVDFDGTIVEHKYPEIGPAVPGAIETLREVQEIGADLILWTMRSGPELAAAVAWLDANGIKLFGVNRNPETDWSDSPKAYCHVYVDDAALGCPLRKATTTQRPMVDWQAVRPVLVAMAKARA